MKMPSLRTLSMLLACAATLAISAPGARAAGPVKLVAAENFYGGIAQQIGGLQVEVTSVLNNPDQDPHLFETSPAVARQLADARIVIYNGADYDPWMVKMLAAAPKPNRSVIVVADLVHAKSGANPHLWYDPATMPKVAQAIAAALSKADPDHASDYAARLDSTRKALARVDARVKSMRTKWAGTPVTATEPVFGLMAQALGLQMRNADFQRAVMNDTEPSARDIAAFEDDLRQHKVKALIVNKQVSDNLTRRLIGIAQKAKVPVVPVTETQPADTTFQDWMLAQLDALDKALKEAGS